MGRRRYHRHFHRRRKRNNTKEIILWIIIIVAIYLLISFLFSPIHFRNIKNAFSKAEGRLHSRESIDMNHNCDFRSVEFFGYEKEDIIKLDCTNACDKKGLSYISYGCPSDRFTCYCN